MPDVRVRSNEELPDPDVKVSHNEWFAVSWETDFGKQIEEHETSKTTNNNQQTVTQEVTDTKDKTAPQQITKNQNEDTNDEAPPSPDFVKPYYRRG